MKIRCPNCNEQVAMIKEDTQHVCPECNTTLTLEEAESMFDDGKLIGILEADDLDDLDDLDSDDEEEMEEESEEDGEEEMEEGCTKKHESFNGFSNKDTWATTLIVDHEYKVFKQLRAAYKKEKLSEELIKSLINKIATDKQDIFEGVDLDNVNWEEVSSFFTEIMKESDQVAVDVVESVFSDVELTEEQKDAIIDIFESAVHVRINDIKAAYKEESAAKLEEAIEEKTRELAEQVSAYTNEVAQSWFEENKIAITESLEVEYSRSFINGLKDLFEEHYVHVPEERYDLVEALADQVKDVEAQLEESEKEKEELQAIINEAKKEKVLSKIEEGMIDTDKDRLRELVESVSFDNEESYEKKVIKLKESFIRESKGSPSDMILDNGSDDTVDDTDSETRLIRRLSELI